jgi:hypothetical protein
MNAIPAIGDFLFSSKAYGAVNHVGVLVGPDIVLQNTPGKGEHVCTMDDFSGGGPVRVCPSGADHMGVLERTRRILAYPRKYNALLRNCEHTAYEAAHGSARSPQIEQALKAAARIVLSLAVARFTGRKGFRIFR